jgi:CheY-like chemotaxis protein
MTNKVLIVDDDPLMHLLYKRHLEGAGYELINASNAIEALEMAKRELPRLIIMDVMMPGTDGLTALRELKKAEATKAIPVIVATANVEQHLAARQEAQFSGAAAFLTKPLSPAQLLSEVKRLVPL